MLTTEDILASAVAIDIETTGLDWHDRVLTVSLAKKVEGETQAMVLNTGYIQHANLFGVSFGESADIRDREIVPLKPNEARLAFQAFIKDATCLIFHNGSFDIPYLVKIGLLTREELESYLIFDTMVWARCTAPHESVSLENLTIDYGIKVDPAWIELKDQRANLENIPWDKVELYSRLDVIYTLELASKMVRLAVEYYEKQGHELIQEESAWVKVISLMRVDGIQIDMAAVKRILAEKKKEQLDLLRQLRSYRIEGPNHRTSVLRWIASIDQTSKLDKTKKGNLSIDNASLHNLTGEAKTVVSLILECRRIEKEISTWVTAPLSHADKAGRIHPLFTVSGAKSNRLTCEHPSAHTFPKSMEQVLFSARPGYRLVALDLKAAELRIAASFAKEKILIETFAKGGDPHMTTAIEIFGPGATREQRRKTKNGTFCRIYGGGAFAFLGQVNKGITNPKLLVSEKEAKEILAAHKAKMPGITRLAKEAERVWLVRGYLRVLGGKRVYASQSDLEKSYKALNYLIQPSVAELVKKAMIRIKEELPDVIMVSQKHDSIFMEVPDDERLEERIDKAGGIMRESYPQYMSDMTDPPIVMEVELERNSEGLPLSPLSPTE